jgi:DNA adenine methylase
MITSMTSVYQQSLIHSLTHDAVGYVQPIPYQGSKRKLADAILAYVSGNVENLYEPFAGSAAVSIAAAQRSLANHYWISDSCEPLVNLWKEIVNNPVSTADKYEQLWNGQFELENHYDVVRDQFNKDGDPIKFLYLMARCVKNAVRFNSSGGFNQSADKRRKGRSPRSMRNQIVATSLLFAGKTDFVSGDYEEIISDATSRDLIYFDPPYLGVSNKRDSRYHQGIDVERLIMNLEDLNTRNVPYLLSFDGSCGNRTYGEALPVHLGMKKVSIIVGRSSQATLNGTDEITIESLYISPNLVETIDVSSRHRELVCLM